MARKDAVQTDCLEQSPDKRNPPRLWRCYGLTLNDNVSSGNVCVNEVIAVIGGKGLCVPGLEQLLVHTRISTSRLNHSLATNK